MIAALINLRRTLPFITLFGLVLVSVTSVTVRSDDPVSSSVTFNREIVRIFERKCLPCHSANSVGMPLTTYREVRPWSRAIREEIVEQRMPPWGAAQGYAPIANDPGLNSRQLAMILTWLDGGLPRGEDRDLPRPATAHEHVAEPDHLVALPAQRIPAGDEHVVRRVRVAAGATVGRVQRVEIRPGDRRVLRAAFVSIVTGRGARTRQWTGAWTPWHPAITPPAGTSFVLPAGAELEAELHYRGRDTDLDDRSAIALFSTEDAADGVAGQIVIDASAEGPPRPAPRARASVTLPSASRVWAVVPRIPEDDRRGAHEAVDRPAVSVEVTARKPDGSVEVLLWVPRYHTGWPVPYVLRDPVSLPAGTRVSLTTTGIRPNAGQKLSVTLATYR